jgi:hypothetical protein
MQMRFLLLILYCLAVAAVQVPLAVAAVQVALLIQALHYLPDRIL